jgi:uncharacterized protein (TIGR03663 family)
LALKNPRTWLTAGIFFAFLLATRFLGLADKPYHHDESLYAVEAWRWATQHLYRFHPMLHGPFEFHFHAGLFTFLPVNDYTGRLPVAIAGLTAAVLGMLLLRGRGASASVTWLALFAVSPVFCFFSRFLGMDLPMAALGLGLMLSLLRLLETGGVRWFYSAVVLATLMVCTKLNFLFYFVAIGTFLPIWWWLGGEKPRTAAVTQAEAAIAFVRRHRADVVTAAALAAVIYTGLYSSLGTNPKGIVDGVVKAVQYWVEQHSIQRIKGPFQYYLPILLLYELPAMAGIVWCALRAARSSKHSKRLALKWALWTLIVLGTSYVGWTRLERPMSLFHLDEPFHPALAFAVVGLWWLLVSFHFRRNEKLEAFFAHWGATQLLLYSYAGEKIPWLTTHILLPWMLYVSAVLPSVVLEMIRSRGARVALGSLLILATAWQATVTIRSSFALAADPRERLVYTHTSWDIKELVRRIHRMADDTGQGKELNVQVVGDSAWPLYWYLRDYRRWFHLQADPASDPLVVICDWDRQEQTKTLLGERYTPERMRLREWWLYETPNMTAADLLRYFVTREVWSPLGSQDVAVYVRNDLRSYWAQLSAGDIRQKTP